VPGATANAPDSGPARVPRLTSSGSGQCSAGGWHVLSERLSLVHPTSLVVVDLRKESHGYINGAAVSWYASRNWGCAGLTALEAIDLERMRLKLVSRADEVIVTTKSAVNQGTCGGDTWRVEEASSERTIVERAGARYARIPVNDHCRPDHDALMDLVGLFSNLPAGSHLHFHCRGGKGRTAMALALLDIYQSAGVDSLAEIIARQTAFSEYALDDGFADCSTYKVAQRRDRWILLQEFYAVRRAMHR
jgi:Inositol hexakisphosphate